MQDLNDKATGNDLTADEWNQMPSELQNIIEQTGQSLNGGDLNQVGKGVAQYAGNGDFYTDSGAVDAYILTTLDTKQSTDDYVDGLRVRFIPTNTNTGASTVNVAGKGVRSIKTQFGDPNAGDIESGREIVLSYSTSTSEFKVLVVPFAGTLDVQSTRTSQSKAVTPFNLSQITATESVTGLVERATQAEVNAGTDPVRYVSPLTLKNKPAPGFQFNVSASGIATNLPAGWTLTKPGIGDYLITHNLGTTNYSLVLSVNNGVLAPAPIVTVGAIGANSSQYTTWDNVYAPANAAVMILFIPW